MKYEYQIQIFTVFFIDLSSNGEIFFILGLDQFYDKET